MTEPQNVPPKLQEQLRHDRALIANELPELTERHDRMVEAKSEDTFFRGKRILTQCFTSLSHLIQKMALK